MLEECALAAEHVEDLRQEYVKDIYGTCKMMKARISRTIEAKTFSGIEDDLYEFIEVNDFIDKKLDAFRRRFEKLKRKAERGEVSPEAAMPQEEGPQPEESAFANAVTSSP